MVTYKCFLGSDGADVQQPWPGSWSVFPCTSETSPLWQPSFSASPGPQALKMDSNKQGKSGMEAKATICCNFVGLDTSLTMSGLSLCRLRFFGLNWHDKDEQQM